MNELTCACCSAPLDPRDAAPAPEGATWRYHADLALCLRELLRQQGHPAVDVETVQAAPHRAGHGREGS